MTGNHTSGPWHVDGYNLSKVIYKTKENRWEDIVETSGPDWKGNARLIAAAPDMLAALEHAKYWLREIKAESNEEETIESINRLLNQIKQAIDKAKPISASERLDNALPA